MTAETVTRTVKFYVEDGIAYYIFLPNAEETLADAKEAAVKFAEMYPNTVYPFLVDDDGLKSITREARLYFADPNELPVKLIKAVALVGKSSLARVLGNFFIKLNQPPYPTQMFASKEEALAWLQQYKNPHV